MDVVVAGRHQQLSERFRAHVSERLEKVEQLAPRALRVEVLVSHEPNRRATKATERVEITAHVRGPVIRAEATHDDKYGAFELAMDKLLERLRRASDRRRVNRGRGAETIRAGAGLTGPLPELTPVAPEPPSADADRGPREGPPKSSDDPGGRVARNGTRRSRLFPLPRQRNRPAECCLSAPRLGIRRHPS